MWAAYSVRHPHSGRKGTDGKRLPSEADTHRMTRAVAEWGAEDVVLLLEWAHLAPDDAATWLQGRGGTNYLGLDHLLVADKMSSRLERARGWDAAGRPRTMPGRVNGKPPARRGMLAIEAFMEDDDPNPAQSRIIDAETWQ